LEALSPAYCPLVRWQMLIAVAFFSFGSLVSALTDAGGCELIRLFENIGGLKVRSTIMMAGAVGRT